MEKLLSQSRATEVSTVFTQSILAYKKSSLSADAYLVNLISLMESKSTGLTEAIKRLKANSELEAKDIVRDDATRALFFLVKGGIYHPVDTVKKASAQLNRILEKHGLSLVDESYAIETALLNSLLLDLADAKLVPAIAAISGCTELIAQLQAAQTDFENTRLDYESSKATEGAHANATALKNEMIRLMNSKLVSYLTGMLLANESGYGSFAATINQLVVDNNLNVRKRSTTNNKGTENVGNES